MADATPAYPSPLLLSCGNNFTVSSLLGVSRRRSSFFSGLAPAWPRPGADGQEPEPVFLPKLPPVAKKK